MENIKNIDQVEKILEENKIKIKDGVFYRFWSKVNITENKEECWNWTASINTNGYGQFFLLYKMVSSHRMSYLLTKGSIHNGLQVQHLCNNRLCCNPNHLKLGNNSKNEQYKSKCERRNNYGENNGLSVLTDDQVREIHKLHKNAGEQRRLKWQFTEPIAQKFGISKGNVGAIIRGKTWHHIYKEFHEGDN